MKNTKNVKSTTVQLSIKNLSNGVSQNTKRLVLIMVSLLVMISVLKGDQFWTVNNFQSMFFQLPEFGILSFCLMLAFTSGGVDLSVVGIANTAAVVTALILIRFAPESAPVGGQITVIVISVLAAIGVGLILGLVNGLLISKLQLPAMLVTLGTEQLYFGLAKVLTHADTLSNIQKLFTSAVNASFFGFITVPLLCFVAVAIILWVLIAKSKYGFNLFMVGSNSKAAKYSGISVEKTLVSTYMLSGILAAIAGLIMMARTNSVKSGYGISYLTQAILTAMLGGTFPSGGYCSIGGVVLAIFVVQVLSSTLNMFTSISNFYRGLIWGLVLLIAITLNYFDERKAKKH